MVSKRKLRSAAVVAVLAAGGGLAAAGPASAREWFHCTDGYVCVYQDLNFDGTYQFWTSYAGSYGVLRNEVSSVVNRAGHSTDFYTGTSYTGTYIRVPDEGTRANLQNYSINDNLESHRPS